MKPYSIQIVNDFISKHSDDFYQSRLNLLDKIELKELLKTKDILLYRINGSSGVCELITSLINTFISSNEVTFFDDWLKQLAIHINHQVYNGWDSTFEGIDLEFDRDNIRYIVSIQSSPNRANSSQINKLKEIFTSAKRTLQTHCSQMVIKAVNGCCFGKDNKPDRGEYLNYFGQRFWEFISGNENTYQDLIIMLEQFTKQRNEKFNNLLEGKITNFIIEFAEDFCFSNGTIDWDKLLQFNSGK